MNQNYENEQKEVVELDIEEIKEVSGGYVQWFWGEPKGFGSNYAHRNLMHFKA